MYQQIKKLIVYYTKGNVTKATTVTDKKEIEKVMEAKRLYNPKLIKVKVVK